MSKSIWDHSYKTAAGTTIREAYFQDEKDAFTLRDYDGKTLSLEDYSEFVYATAERKPGNVWWVTVRDGKSPRYQRVYSKQAAIDLVLGKETQS